MQLRILHSHNAGTAASHDHDDLAHTLIWCLREWQTRHQISRYPNLYCACSKAAAEYMFPGKPFTWVRNGINTVHFAYDEVVRSATRAELHIAPSTSVIGFAGDSVHRRIRYSCWTYSPNITAWCLILC